MKIKPKVTAAMMSVLPLIFISAIIAVEPYSPTSTGVLTRSIPTQIASPIENSLTKCDNYDTINAWFSKQLRLSHILEENTLYLDALLNETCDFYEKDAMQLLFDDVKNISHMHGRQSGEFPKRSGELGTDLNHILPWIRKLVPKGFKNQRCCGELEKSVIAIQKELADKWNNLKNEIEESGKENAKIKEDLQEKQESLGHQLEATKKRLEKIQQDNDAPNANNKCCAKIDGKLSNVQNELIKVNTEAHNNEFKERLKIIQDKLKIQAKNATDARETFEKQGENIRKMLDKYENIKNSSKPRTNDSECPKGELDERILKLDNLIKEHANNIDNLGYLNNFNVTICLKNSEKLNKIEYLLEQLLKDTQKLGNVSCEKEDIGNTGVGNIGHSTGNASGGGPGKEGSGNAGAGNDSSGNTGVGNGAPGKEGSGNAGAENEGSGNTGVGNGAPGKEGSGNAGAGNDSSGNTGVGNGGHGKEGSGNAGAGNDSSGNTGVGNGAPGKEGSGNAGAGTEGSTIAGSGNGSSGINNLDGTPHKIVEDRINKLQQEGDSLRENIKMSESCCEKTDHLFPLGNNLLKSTEHLYQTYEEHINNMSLDLNEIKGLQKKAMDKLGSIQTKGTANDTGEDFQKQLISIQSELDKFKYELKNLQNKLNELPNKIDKPTILDNQDVSDNLKEKMKKFNENWTKADNRLRQLEKRGATKPSGKNNENLRKLIDLLHKDLNKTESEFVGLGEPELFHKSHLKKVETLSNQITPCQNSCSELDKMNDLIDQIEDLEKFFRIKLGSSSTSKSTTKSNQKQPSRKSESREENVLIGGIDFVEQRTDKNVWQG